MSQRPECESWDVKKANMPYGSCDVTKAHSHWRVLMSQRPVATREL